MNIETRAWPRAGPPIPPVIGIECSSDRSLRPFPWPQRTSFTLYIFARATSKKKKRYSCPVPRVPMATIRAATRRFCNFYGSEAALDPCPVFGSDLINGAFSEIVLMSVDNAMCAVGAPSFVP